MRCFVKYIIVVLVNILLGLISFWWFILAYAMAVNIDHKADAEVMRPFGFIGLAFLILLVAGSNYLLYKRYRNVPCVVIVSILSFLIGLAISFAFS